MRSDLRADVLVIGGGVAGFGAAVAAGRQGLDVVLMEAGPKIGGVMAFCPGMPWGGGYPCDQIIGGLIAELSDRLAGLAPPAAETRRCTLENFGREIVYDPDMAQVVMFEMLEEAGVRVHLNTVASEPGVDDARIEFVEFHDRHGPGVVTLSFLLVDASWNTVFAEGDPYFTRHAERGVAQGRLHPDLSKIYMMKGFHRDTVFCNSVIVRGVDGTQPEEIARATQEGRRRCRALVEFLRDEVPGFEKAWMTNLGPTVGVRETRKLQGVYRLTDTDIAAARKFSDGIVACANPIDDVMRGDGEMTHDAAVTDNAYYTLPFRCLVPRKVENLLFAGRNVSADPVAFASIRGMPQCMAMGQAVGTAAGIALEAGIPVQAIDGTEVAARMKAQGLWGLP
jgi:hypothetical protein